MKTNKKWILSILDLNNEKLLKSFKKWYLEIKFMTWQKTKKTHCSEKKVTEQTERKKKNPNYKKMKTVSSLV